jgi:hypothetical protein
LRAKARIIAHELGIKLDIVHIESARKDRQSAERESAQADSSAGAGRWLFAVRFAGDLRIFELTAAAASFFPA